MINFNHWFINFNHWFVDLNHWYIDFNQLFIDFNHWFIDINHWLAQHYTGRHYELRHSTLWHSSNSYPINIHPEQKCWRHTNETQPFSIRRSRTEPSRRKDSITKTILKPHSHSPNRHWSQTFCRETFQIWALKYTDMPHTHNRHTVIGYTDI